jgi:hypothetical protein
VSDYLEEDYGDDVVDDYAESPGDDLEQAIAPIVDEMIEQRLGAIATDTYEPDDGADHMDEQEARWAEEDAAAAAQEQAAREDEQDLTYAAETLRKVGKELGVDDNDDLEQAFHVADKLYSDPTFVPNRDEHERAHAAIRAGVDSFATPKDELEAAEKFMTRRRLGPAEGAPDPALERRLEAGSIMVGMTAEDKRMVREQLGWPAEES